MTPKKIFVFLFNFFLGISLLLTTLCSCENQNKFQKEEKEKNFVTSFYPMYIFAKNITNGAKNVKVTNMTQPQTGCLHDYQLLPKDIKKLENADAFIINGGDTESFMEKIFDSKPNLFVITASEGLYCEDEHHEEHEHEKSHKHSHEKDGHNHENSHFWTYIPYATKQIKNITSGLCEVDFENAELYKKNSEEYIKRLSELDKNFKESIKNFKSKKIITTDEAFEYFAEGYGLEIVGTLNTEHNSAPSAKELKNLCDIAKTTQIPIFVARNSNKTAAETVASETNSKIFELNPITTGSYENLSELKKALKH